MKTYKVKDRQTLADIALMLGGGLESIADLAFVNEMAVTDELTQGLELQTGRVCIADSLAFKRYQEQQIVPATGITPEELPHGIEFWGIEFDFEVYE